MAEDTAERCVFRRHFSASAAIVVPREAGEAGPERTSLNQPDGARKISSARSLLPSICGISSSFRQMLADASPGFSSGDANGAKRRKVTRACDRCKARKRRCNGDQPCALCTAHNVPCCYDTPYSRGRPALPGPQRQQSQHRPNENGSSPIPPQRPNATRQIQDSAFLNAVNAEETNANGISRSSRAASPSGEGIAQPGHYLGPTSTFSFLRRAGRRFGRIAGESKEADDKQDGSIFANGDIVFPAEDERLIEFPSEATIRLLVRRYFDFAVPSHRFFHQQTIESWVSSLSEIQDARDRTLRPVREAAIYLIMATALLYKVDEHGIATGAVDSIVGPESDMMREKFFQAAQVRIHGEKGVARLESVQARLAAVLYLLNTSRLNQAWYMLGTTYQLIIALGLHTQRSSTGASNRIVQECKRRCYWVAFTVDTYFSVMLGRLPLMNEQGADQRYPTMTNDENTTADSTCHGPVTRDCVQAAPVFHARLAKIIREASSEQYLAHKLTTQQQLETAQRLNERIAEWHRDLPVFLSGGIHPATLVPIFRRQLRVLHMAAAHATMIVNRPLILSSASDVESIRPHVDQCVTAARRVLEMVLELVDHNHLFRAFWNFQYITFHALSVVYVWIIQLKGDRERALHTEHDKQHLCELAEKVQAHLAEATQLNAPNLRYSIILEELKQEALRALNRRAPRVQHSDEVSVVPSNEMNATPGQESQFNSVSDWESMLDFPTDPELWLQLDSFPFDGTPRNSCVPYQRC